MQWGLSVWGAEGELTVPGRLDPWKHSDEYTKRRVKTFHECGPGHSNRSPK